MSIKHVIIEGFGFAPVGFVITEGFGALTEDETPRQRGDTWPGPGPSKPRRYLDRLEKQERDELTKALDKALDEVTGSEELPAKPLTKKEVKRAAAVVKDSLDTIILPPEFVFSAGFIEITSSLANLEKTLREYYEIRRYREEQAAIAEAIRLDDEAAALLLAAMM